MNNGGVEFFIGMFVVSVLWIAFIVAQDLTFPSTIVQHGGGHWSAPDANGRCKFEWNDEEKK